MALLSTAAHSLTLHVDLLALEGMARLRLAITTSTTLPHASTVIRDRSVLHANLDFPMRVLSVRIVPILG